MSYEVSQSFADTVTPDKVIPMCRYALQATKKCEKLVKGIIEIYQNTKRYNQLVACN